MFVFKKLRRKLGNPMFSFPSTPQMISPFFVKIHKSPNSISNRKNDYENNLKGLCVVFITGLYSWTVGEPWKNYFWDRFISTGTFPSHSAYSLMLHLDYTNIDDYSLPGMILSLDFFLWTPLIILNNLKLSQKFA